MKKQRLIFLTSFSLFFWLSQQSQTQDECLNFAKTQYEIGNYNIAIKEYKRVLFFDSSECNNAINNQLGRIYLAKKKYDNAVHHFSLAQNCTQNDSILNSYYMIKGECYLKQKKYNLALIEFFSIIDMFLNVKQQQLKNFLIGTCYYGLSDFVKAEFFFLKIPDITDNESREQISKLFKKKKNYMKPNPGSMATLSLFVPGLGQIYSGDVKSGLNSLGLLGLLVYAGYHVSSHLSFIDAVLTIFPTFQRYYTGGYKNAKKIAEFKRKQRRNESYNKIIDVLNSSN